MKTELVLALDVYDIDLVKKYITDLKGRVKYFKVGNQLFTSFGPEVVRMITENGISVFLDLKYHDIPNTVEQAARAAVRLGVSIMNVHTVGGLEMMKRAVSGAKDEAAKLGIPAPVVLGVTVLTSMDKELYAECFGNKTSVSDTVLFLCSQAKKAGLDGVVASPMEIRLIKDAAGEGFKVLTPGIRPKWASADDQKRIATPKEAVKSGADYIVVGRPILKSHNPFDAANKILEEMETEE